MATVDQYKIKIDVQGRDQVQQVEADIDALNGKLGVLGGTLRNVSLAGAAAFSALATSAVMMADQLVDLAGVAGMSAGKIYQMSVAAEAAGGSFEDTGNILLKFSSSLDRAVQGSQEMLDAFQKVGVGRKELETLSDEQLFQAVVSGLGNMEDSAEKTALAMELLGKRAATMDLGSFAKSLEQATDPNIERSLLLAADAVGAIETAFRNAQIAVLTAIAPILSEISKIELSIDDVKKAIQVFASVLAGAFAAVVVSRIVAVVQAIRTLGGVMRGVAVVQAAILGMSGAGWALIGAGVAAATATYYALGESLKSAEEDAKKLNAELGKGGADVPGVGRTTGGKIRDVQSSDKTKQMQQQALAARQVTEQMIRQNDEANKLRRITMDTIGMETDRADLIRSNAQAESDSRKQIADLDARIVAERAKGKDTNAAVIVELEKQKNIVSGQVQEAIRLNELEYKRLQTQKLITDRQQIQLEYNRQLSDEYNYHAETTQLLLRANGTLTKDQIDGAQRVTQEYLRMNTTINTLNQQLAAATENKNQTEIVRINELISLERDRYDRALALIKERQAAEEKLNQSTIAGIGDAMSSIAKQFEPYKMAQDAIMMGWNKIGSAVDEFVETGKFKFKDFARSVIQDLLKMIIKAQMFKAIQATLGVFGFKIPGLATGGPAKAGQPYIVGEKGPELFVPKSAGTVIPNHKLGASAEASGSNTVNAPVTNNYITNNISAVDAKSVAQLFAENRKTLLGTVQMAQREMPYGV